MNRHFSPPNGDAVEVKFPLNAYGRIDHVELSRFGVHGTALIAFDLVDADWIDQTGHQDPRFSLTSDQGRAQAWSKYRAALATGAPVPNPFDKAPLYRLEVEVALGESWYSLPVLPSPNDPGFDDAVGRLETEWVRFDGIDRAGPFLERGAQLYPGLFAEPISVIAQGRRLPTGAEGKALSDIFSLENLPTLSTSDAELAVARCCADYLAVYDVGQGNANALLDRHLLPTLYYDHGAGVYRNRKSTPSKLLFCYTQNPTIVLSHWDADHWAGAYASTIGGKTPALQRDWMAPLQTVGPVHIAFAHDIATAGGNVFIYQPPKWTVGSSTAKTGQQIRFALGAGGDRNGTGIVMSIEAQLPSTSVGWLLTGDCDYRHFISHLSPSEPIAIVAPHHGADLHHLSVPPKPSPASPSYRRLVYSFGRDNQHGRGQQVQHGQHLQFVRHPTVGGVDPHKKAGWDHGTWNLSQPLPSVDDVRATCEHLPGQVRGGILVGWTMPLSSVPPLTPCGGVSCHIPITQT